MRVIGRVTGYAVYIQETLLLFAEYLNFNEFLLRLDTQITE